MNQSIGQIINNTIANGNSSARNL